MEEPYILPRQRQFYFTKLIKASPAITSKPESVLSKQRGRDVLTTYVDPPERSLDYRSDIFLMRYVCRAYSAAYRDSRSSLLYYKKEVRSFMHNNTGKRYFSLHSTFHIIKNRSLDIF